MAIVSEGLRTVKLLRLKKAFTLLESTTINEAYRRMDVRKVDVLLLRLKGITLLTTRVIACELDIENTPVSAIMTSCIEESLHALYIKPSIMPEDSHTRLTTGDDISSPGTGREAYVTEALWDDLKKVKSSWFKNFNVGRGVQFSVDELCAKLDCLGYPQ
ncbi:hypothetical protein CTI12_AA213780 [Artemisia annua]|uniref:Uncharacterized protein n=1 Tax=Artemisia annua TaxID=35608 RepID=A0A2U1NXV6_ARTAN|nr:hypothetical protein CTI12_AA213780 [Artemisia annua]